MQGLCFGVGRCSKKREREQADRKKNNYEAHLDADLKGIFDLAQIALRKEPGDNLTPHILGSKIDNEGGDGSADHGDGEEHPQAFDEITGLGTKENLREDRLKEPEDEACKDPGHKSGYGQKRGKLNGSPFELRGSDAFQGIHRCVTLHHTNHRTGASSDKPVKDANQGTGADCKNEVPLSMGDLRLSMKARADISEIEKGQKTP